MFEVISHRRRIKKTEASVLGDRFDSIPCLASYCALGRFEEYSRTNRTRLIWRKGWIHPILQNRPIWKIASAARNWINSSPPNRRNYLCLLSLSCYQLWGTISGTWHNPSSEAVKQDTQPLFSNQSTVYCSQRVESSVILIALSQWWAHTVPWSIYNALILKNVNEVETYFCDKRVIKAC